MKFVVQKAVLSEALQLVQRIAPNRPTNPILANVLLEAVDGQVVLTTKDEGISIRRSLAAEVAEAGAITLPAKRFASIVKELPDGAIQVEMGSDASVRVECGSSFFKFVGIAADQYPAVQSPGEGLSYTLERSNFANILRRTSYAASRDESRLTLNSVLLNFSDGKLTTVATDGRRLAMIEHEVVFPAENNKDVILPSRIVAELLSMVDGEGDVKIHVKDNQAAFEFADTLLICQLVDGLYPNFRQVVVAQCEHRIALPREDMLGVLRRMMNFTSEKNNAIRLTFQDNLLTVQAQTPDVGEATETIAVKYSGPEISAIFNPEFLSEPLRNLTSDEVYIELTDANSPGLIKSDIPFLYVLMPLRV